MTLPKKGSGVWLPRYWLPIYHPMYTPSQLLLYSCIPCDAYLKSVVAYKSKPSYNLAGIRTVLQTQSMVYAILLALLCCMCKFLM